MRSIQEGFATELVQRLELILTKRAQKRLRKKKLQNKKHPVLDWLEAFLWAAFVVLLCNQYFLQAYRIPSASMMNTLVVGDRLFVDKFSYGPELLPGFAKISGLEQPSRAQVFCFENPSYISPGPLFMVSQRIMYMLTLSLIDIDTERGEPRMYLLIKRALGMPGEQWRYEDGRFMIKPPGTTWMTEESFMKESGIQYTINKDIPLARYPESRLALQNSIKNQLTSLAAGTGGFMGQDAYWSTTSYAQEQYSVLPRLGQDDNLSHAINGWYVPEGYILPLGDNRDRSNDGRYFGPIPQSKILGKALFLYWPFNRIGLIH